MEIQATLIRDKTIHADFSTSLDIDGKIVHPAQNIYNGSYIVTPSTQTQILETEGLVMNDDVIIEKIPDNYGLISWNGFVLTVS